jgi:glutamate N-acetyltransferase/amino-acid N-acetyltransferase
MSYTIFEDGHISSPEGFRSTGVACGLKEGSKTRDLALVYSLRPCTSAAMFTRSTIQGAPVFLNQAVLSRNRDNLRAVLINAGQANTGTGKAGLTDAIECAKLVADELEIPRDSVLLMSTGMIGVPIPMSRMRNGIRRAVSELDSGGGRRAALAMLTTDSRPKERVVRVQLGEGRRVTLAGMAKGTRMIHPQLATLLCMITTDAAITPGLLHMSLQQSMERSFNRLSVDGDGSPNDAVILLANGAVDDPVITDSDSWAYGAWQEALDFLCADLAQQVLRDATGTGKILRMTVRGAENPECAHKVAEALMHSRNLRRICLHGTTDWGVLLAAIGTSGVALQMELLELRVGSVLLMQTGMPVSFDPAVLVQQLSQAQIDIAVDLHMGLSETTVWTCTWHEE